MECPVCIETIKEEFKSPCGHSTCSACFEKWRDEQVKKCCSVTCPSCRFVIIEVSTVKVDMFEPPLGYVDIEERHIPPYITRNFGVFPSMPEQEYQGLFTGREDLDEEFSEIDDEEDEDDLDSKDDWEYEDMGRYAVAVVHTR